MAPDPMSGVGQRDEHLLNPPPVLPDVVLVCGVSAGEPVLVPEPLKDSLRRVALLPGDLRVCFQDGVNHPGEGLKLGPAGWVLASLPWWCRVGQHLAHRVPVQAKHPGGFPNAHPFHHAGPANPRVHIHCKHLSHLLKTDKSALQKAVDGTIFRRHISASRPAHVVHFTAAFYSYARVSVREPEDKNLDLPVERLVRAGYAIGNVPNWYYGRVLVWMTKEWLDRWFSVSLFIIVAPAPSITTTLP